MKWLALLLLMLSTATLAAQPDHIEARYDVLMSGLKVGEMLENYTRTDDHYLLTSITTPLGLMAVLKPGQKILNSQGLIDTQGLHPLNFEDKTKDSRAAFDWPAKQLTLTHQALHLQLALPEGTQDRLSAMYQFMFVALDSLTQINFAMTNGNKLDNYHYAINTPEPLTTPAGKFEVWHLDSQSKTGENRTEIWLETRHHLPCKMVITDASGEQITQVLSGLKITP